MEYEEDSSVFQLPTNPNVAPAVVFEAPKAPETPVSSVAEAAKVTPVVQPVTPVVSADNLSDQALFNELNAVSEEVIECRNRILSKIC